MRLISWIQPRGSETATMQAAVHCGLLPATRLASRKILIEQNIKKGIGPALYEFSL
jgi:hypothetical protein